MINQVCLALERGLEREPCVIWSSNSSIGRCRDGISAPDGEIVENARAALKVLRAARQAIDSLALNDIVTKARAQVERVIENSSKTHVDRLRNAPSEERAVLTEVVEVVIDFARIAFDETYAALIRRSLHVASTNANLKSA